MKEVANRIQEIIKNKGISNSEMADSIGLPRPILSHILSGRNKPSLAVIQKITETYSDIDVKWLLVGVVSETRISTQKEMETDSNDTKKGEPSEKQEVKSPQGVALKNPSRTTALTSNNEITQIVHYFTDGTFKVFTPDA